MFGRVLPTTWLTPLKRRVAPGMLAQDGETPFIRNPWQMNAFPCDIDTGEHLIERCPKCGAILDWVDVTSVAFCVACGFDLRLAQPTFVSGDELANVHEAFQYIVDRNPCLPEGIRELDDLSVFHGLEWFAYFADLRVGKYLRPSCVNALRGFAALKSWPHSFDGIVGGFLSDLADPPSYASASGKENLLAQLLQVISRAETAELHKILTERAVIVLGSSTADSLKTKQKILAPKLGHSAKPEDRVLSGNLQGRICRDLMRSNHA